MPRLSPAELSTQAANLQHSKAEVRRTAAMRLGESRSEQILPLLIPRLKDENETVATQSMHALAATKNARAYQAILPMLGHKSRLIRMMALGHFEKAPQDVLDKHADEILEHVIHAVVDDVGKQEALAVARRFGPQAAVKVQDYLKDAKTRTAAMRIIAQSGHKSPIHVLRGQGLNLDDDQTWLDIHQMLKEMNPGNWRTQMIELLRHP